MKRFFLAALAVVGTVILFSAAGCVAPPATINDTCGADVTAQLNKWVASQSPGSVIELPANACYLVSSTSPYYGGGAAASPTFVIHDTDNLTIEGNGATFRQTSYDGGTCGSDLQQPVVWLAANRNLTIKDVNIDGPGNCVGGGSNEGDYGLLIGQDTTGNTGITLDDVNISNMDGDGILDTPYIADNLGVNSGVTYENSTISNVGYHVLTVEGADGLDFTHNHVTDYGSFMNLEVDNACGSNSCLTNGQPTGVAQWNITVAGNSFTDDRSSNALWITSEEDNCIPQKNLTIWDNTLDSTVPAGIILGGSREADCQANDTGLSIVGNRAQDIASSPCPASIAWPPGCAIIEVEDYTDVTIANNTIPAFDGSPDYYPNTPWVPCMGLQAVNGVTMEHNACPGAWDGVGTMGMQYPSLTPVNTGLYECGNSWGAAIGPQSDGACTAESP
jgi:hypothetical protein